MEYREQHVSDKEVAAALHSVALLVNVYGDKYWPIFERLEEEWDKRRSKSKRLAQVLQDPNQSAYELRKNVRGHS